MAKNIATFIIDVVTKNLKAAQAGTENLGKNARAAAASYNSADKSAGGFYNTQAKGVIGTANSTKSFSKLAETMNSSSGVVGAYATLAANVFAVTAAFNALRGAAQVQQVQAGLEAMGNRMGTTLSVAASNLREISGMTLTVEQSLRSTAQIASAGFGTKTISDLGKVANDVSVALGRNMTDSMDRLTRGVIKLEPELLDELGLMTKLGEASAKYANQLGKSESQLSSFEKRQGFLNAIVAEGEAKFGGLADSAGNTRNLDLLAATFSDLTKEIFTVINKAALPLAALLSNKGILLGGMLLFASTISKQLLPGLTNLQIKAAQTAIALKEAAKAQVNVIPTAPTEPRAVKGLRTAIANDKADITTYQKALDAISKEEAKLTAEIAAGGSTRKKYRKMNVEALEEERGVLNDQAVTIRRTMLLEQQAAASTTGANAIAAAGQKKLLVSWFLLTNAVKQYKIAVDQAAASSGRLGALSGILTTLKTGFFAASIGARALGAAFISMLGTIGLVISAVYALYEGFKWLKEWWDGPEVKKYNSALEEQDTILGELNKRYDEMVRVRNSNVPVAVKEQAIYKIMTNTVRENIEAYEKVKEAQDAVFKNKSSVKVGDTREFETLKQLKEMGAPEVRRQIDEALGKEGLTGILEDAGKEIDKDKLGKLSKIITQDLRQGAVTLGDHINDLAEAFKNADTAIAEFNRSAIPSTPYDQIVANLDTVANSLTNIISTASQSDSFINRLAHTVTAAGPNFQKFFSPDLQKTIRDFNELDEKMNKAGYKATYTDNLRRRELSEILALRSSEVFEVQEIFLNAQKLARQTEIQIGLEKSRLEKLNSYTALTGSSIKERRESENKIIQLQANQIKAQLEIVKRQIEVTKQQLEFNKVLLETDRIYQGIILSIGGVGEANNKNFIQEIQRRIISLQRERSNPLGRSTEDINKEIAELTDVLTKRQQIEAINASIRNQQDQIIAGEGQIAALLNQQTSALVINAEANALNAKTAADNGQKQLDITQQQIKNAKILSDIAVKQRGFARTTTEEYNQMVAEQEALTGQQKLQIALAANAEIQEMRVQQARAASNSEEVAAYDTRILQTQQLATAKMVELDRQAQLNILEKFSFDIHKEGLQMQRDSLQYLEKQLTAEGELVALQREGKVLSAEIARRKSGRADNPFRQRSEAIAEAKEALILAKQQASLRKTIIDLEYALLEAQRQQAIWNLEGQRQILGANSEQGKQLSIVIERLKGAGGAIADAQAAATKAVDQNIQNLAKKLEILGLGEGSNFIGSGLKDLIKMRQDMRQARNLGASEQLEEPAKAMESYIAPLVESNSKLVSATMSGTEATIALTEQLKQASSAPIPEVQEALTTIIAAGKKAQGMGLSVTENDAFGWQTPGRRASDRKGHSRNSAHYTNQAIDINAPGKVVEADHSKWGPIFDKLAAEYRALGFKVLWRTADHYNHLHVEMTNKVKQNADKLGVKATEMFNIPIVAATKGIEAQTEIVKDTAEASIETVKEAKDAIKEAKDSLPSAANDNPITISGQAKKPEIPLDLESLGMYFTELTQNGEFNMMQVFEEMAEKLGPQGNIVPQIISGITNISNAMVKFQEVMASDNATWQDKFVAGAAVAQQALSTISSVLQSVSNARIAAVDREIAAEQKRDGKSAESVAKLKALEQKKDAIQRKAFNTNKKIMMAQAIIATAAGVAQALTLGPIAGPIMAAVIGALGAAQLAIIAGTSYQSTSAANFDQKTMPDTLTIGKRGDGVDVAKTNTNIGGELGYLRGTAGSGSNSSNYGLARPVGSAYGGPLPRGYGNSAFLVGEKGPEVIEPAFPVNVKPAGNDNKSSPVTAMFNITAFDGQSVQEMLYERRGEIVDMLRETANADGVRFLEDVNTEPYKKTGRRGASKF